MKRLTRGSFAPPLQPELPPDTPTLPVTAARPYAARWNCSPYAVRPGANPQWIAAGRRVANSIASRRSVAAGTPVIAAAHSGVFGTPSVSPMRYARYEAPRGAPGGRWASSKPSTSRSRNAWSWRPSATMTCVIAMSAAASVDGRMKTCSSARARLVRVRRGSTHTIRVPRWRAHRRYSNVPVPKCPSPGLQPHIRMTRELA